MLEAFRRRFSLVSLMLGLANCGGESQRPNTPDTVSAPDAGAQPTAKTPPHWTYDEAWGDLAPEFATCKTGQKQTPIDLASSTPAAKELAPLVVAYPPFPLSIFNNGHTVQVDAAAAGGTLTAEGKKWPLVQFHFHAPSEHTLNGKTFPAELHFVHKNDKGELAVVGILLEVGTPNTALASVFDNAPVTASKGPTAVPSATLDLSALFPAKAAYYTYAGSLTTPPCSEGVTWYVLASPRSSLTCSSRS